MGWWIVLTETVTDGNAGPPDFQLEGHDLPEIMESMARWMEHLGTEFRLTVTHRA